MKTHDTIHTDRLPGARRLAILQQELKQQHPLRDPRYATTAAIPDPHLRGMALRAFSDTSWDPAQSTPDNPKAHKNYPAAPELRPGVRVRQTRWGADEWYVVAKVTSEGVYLNDHSDAFVDYAYQGIDWVVHPDDMSPFRVGRWTKRVWFSNWYKITEVDHDNRKFALVDSDGRLRGWQSMDEPDPDEKWVFKD